MTVTSGITTTTTTTKVPGPPPDSGERGTVVGGIDGCRAGWVLVTVPVAMDEVDRVGGIVEVDVVDAVDEADGAPVLRFDPVAVEVGLIRHLAELTDDLDSGRLAAAAIDIPLGLPTCGPRAADVEARKLLGSRRNSVFPAPARRVLGSRTYEEACARSRAVCGKAISRQLFNILPKIEEADMVQSCARQHRLVEMCPELSLSFIAGAPMTYPKTSPEGRIERLEALGSVFGRVLVDRHAANPPSGARADDVLDAFAGAWTALRVASGSHVRLGGDCDERGLRMQVVA
jgi:predicted RNase H-like nuclease